jgi:molecular chaperone GrpE
MTKSDKKKDEILSNDESTSNENKIEKTEVTDKKKEEISLENKLKITEEKLLRSMAEMENQRRRFEKERQDAFEFGGFNFAKESLSLLDNLERAVNSFKNDEVLQKNKELNKIIDGIEVVRKDLVSIFKKNGIELIECINKKFDPNFHQAMLEIEDDTKEAGTIIQEIQKGYLMKDRLLRPSLVGVTKRSDKKPQENEKNGEKK